MFRNTVEDKIAFLKFLVDGMHAKYGKRPTSIIIGANIWREFACYSQGMLINWDEHGVRKYELFGIPVTIDYDRPKHAEVCMGTVINL